MRKTAIFCLLFSLKIDKPEYRKKAIDFINDSDEDEEVKRWAISGLGQTYQNSKDQELTKLLFKKFNDLNEDESLMNGILSAILMINGIDNRQQLLRTNKINCSASLLMESFEKEFELIKQRVN
ncbi:hypothetical protein [Luteirhabdus pelagi]|uniref:hypothetical protein n=1 Tax=Luteirhabdus pelagi TaxID=2792783 RepID=UPI00193A4AB4|nr:hypothetical protein [Luteirhabdus pelagi]